MTFYDSKGKQFQAKWVRTSNGKYRHPVKSPVAETGKAKWLMCQDHLTFVRNCTVDELKKLPICPRCKIKSIENEYGEHQEVF